MAFIKLHYTDGREVIVNTDHIIRFCNDYSNSHRCVNLVNDYIEVRETIEEIDNLINDSQKTLR